MTDPTRSRPGYEDDAADKLLAPAASRNAAPITEAVARLLRDEAGEALEIGSGTGQHAVALAAAPPACAGRPPIQTRLTSPRSAPGGARPPFPISATRSASTPPTPGPTPPP